MNGIIQELTGLLKTKNIGTDSDRALLLDFQATLEIKPEKAIKLMRALGDSKTPLYFLVTSAFLNIFGDLFFVVVLRWGVAGSAIATVCSDCLLYTSRCV